MGGRDMVEQYELPELPRREVMRFMGYRGQEVSAELEGRVDEGIASCLSLARPRASWREFPLAGRSVRADGVPELRLSGCSLVLEGTSVARHLEGAASCVLLAVTVGMGVERELRRLSATDQVGFVIFDAAGTVAVEVAANACSRSIATAVARRGLFTNARFSPGYGDLPLAAQPQLLAAVDAQRRLGITLSSTLLMTPTKSVTAVVGVFEQDARARRAARASGAAS